MTNYNVLVTETIKVNDYIIVKANSAEEAMQKVRNMEREVNIADAIEIK